MIAVEPFVSSIGTLAYKISMGRAVVLVTSDGDVLTVAPYSTLDDYPLPLASAALAYAEFLRADRAHYRGANTKKMKRYLTGR
jgi:hypothetical protein